MFSIEGVSSSPGKAQLLPDDQLRAAISSRGNVAVVRVTEVIVTDNEKVSITAVIETPIVGRAMRLAMTRAGRHPGVARGQSYVVAVSGGGELLGYTSVGDLERTLEAHRRACERLARR